MLYYCFLYSLRNSMFWKKPLAIFLPVFILSALIVTETFLLVERDDSFQDSLQVTVNVDTTRHVHLVSKKFVSVSFDSRLLQAHWVNLNFSSPRFFTLARGLSPAFLRIGGTPEDWLHFVNKQDTKTAGQTTGYSTLFQSNNFTDYNITGEDLDKIQFIASKAGWDVLFGLNVCLRTKNGTWDYSNPLKILDYVARKGYNFGWELGNEPQHLERFNRFIDAKTLAKDFVTLRGILNKNLKYGKLLVGPDSTKLTKASMDFLKKYLSVARNAIDVITWHQYYFNSRTCKVQDFYDPEIFDYLLDQLNLINSVVAMAAPGKRQWLGETATAWGGGAQGLSNAFAATFTWLDKLGLAARLGTEIVVKQTFFHGHYALVDDQINPTPNYWLSLLHKRLVGQKVLDVRDGLKEKRVVRVYAHCANTKSTLSRQYKEGDVTLLAINLNPSYSVMLKLEDELNGLPVDQYLLTPGYPDVTSQFVKLNGVLLKMTDDFTLPPLEPVSVAAGIPLTLPPLTLGLFVVPGANVEACL